MDDRRPQVRKPFARNVRSGISRGRGGKPHIPHVLLHGVEHKSCGGCGSLKPLTDYTQDRARVDGLHYLCKTCTNGK